MPTSLARRVGLLPVWAWIAAAAAVFLVWRRHNEPGWFPTISYMSPIGGGGEDGPIARLSLMLGGGEPEPEGMLGSSSGSAFDERDTQTSSIIEGGPDGSVSLFSGSGGSTTPSGGGGGEAYTPVQGTGPSSPKPRRLILPKR